MYYIRRLKDNRLIAGLFMPIETKELANRILKQWQHNCPNETFYIQESQDD